MLEQFLTSIKNILDNQLTTLNGHLTYWVSKYQGHLSVSNISESGYKGILTKIQIKDTAVASAFDATISINIDGAGAQVLNLNTMYKINPDAGGENVPDNLSNGIYGGGTTDQSIITLQLNIPFQTSLVVSISNADGFCIFWNEEV